MNKSFESKWHELLKYRPEFYDNTCYKKNEWTSVGDIGKRFDEGILTFDKYIEVENRFIETVVEILKKLDCKNLTIKYREPSTIGRRISKSQRRIYPFKLLAVMRKLRRGDIISIQELPDIIKIMLRNMAYIELCNNKLDIEMSVGYDYYFHIRCGLPEVDLHEIASQHKLFVDPRGISHSTVTDNGDNSITITRYLAN